MHLGTHGVRYVVLDLVHLFVLLFLQMPSINPALIPQLACKGLKSLQEYFSPHQDTDQDKQFENGYSDECHFQVSIVSVVLK